MSTEATFKNIQNLLSAKYPLLYTITTEYSRTMQYVRNIAESMDYHFFRWNFSDGLEKHTKMNGNRKIEKQSGCDDYIGLLNYLSDGQQTPSRAVYFVEDLHKFIENQEVFTLLRKLYSILGDSNKHLIIAGPFCKLPAELEKYVTIIDIPLPDKSDLSKLLRHISGGEKLDPQIENALIDSALGMTDMEAQLAFNLAKQKHGLNSKTACEVITKEKEQIIKKNGILDYFQTDKGLNESIGGLDRLKQWLRQRQKAFDKDAIEYGLKEPKGILLVGIPGCGKSLTAKCVAAEWKLPLIKLDIGKAFEGLVGASENNIRNAIATAEAVAPCVLWIDEIEKGLGKQQGETDGGTSSRVFSTILTWMQEKQKPVFVVATANDIQALPPELLRKGRFDEIFYVDLPTITERKQIFDIHLKKYGQHHIKESQELAEQAIHFNGAEIEECIKDAMFMAFDENPTKGSLKASHILSAIESLVPLARTMPKQIQFLREFGQSNRARNASSESNKEEINVGKYIVQTSVEKQKEIYSI